MIYHTNALEIEAYQMEATWHAERWPLWLTEAKVRGEFGLEGLIDVDEHTVLVSKVNGFRHRWRVEPGDYIVHEPETKRLYLLKQFVFEQIFHKAPQPRKD